ncbi:MAG: HD domain-containing protein [PVC group bacterium]|nr:HD domain-containing protein [PVC group bacterium]
MKKSINFKNPVNDLCDIYGNLLVKSQEYITQALIEQVIRNSKCSNKKISLSKTSIIPDFKTAINSDSYKTIFSDKNNLKTILSIMKSVQLNTSIIKELQAIKQTQPHTYKHILVVASLATKISLDLQNEGYDPVKTASVALAHDMGKSRIPLEILEKNTPLTRAEFKIIQTHPIIEYLLLSAYLKDANAFIAQTTFAHHERLDGTGYPMGIRELNQYAQTIIPCDIFDALISFRPYRNEPFTVRAALDLLLEESKRGKINKHFVLCLISYCRKTKPHFKQVKPSDEQRDAPPSINHYGVRAD